LTSAFVATNDALAADPLTPLQVAYAGSMGSMMDGGVKPAIAKSLGADQDAYLRTIGTLARIWPEIEHDILGPFGLPRHPVSYARFAIPALFYRSSRSWWLMNYYVFFPHHLPANKTGAKAGEDENV